MAVTVFTLNEDHVKLLKQLNWSMVNNIISGIGHDGDDYMPPFGDDNLYEIFDLILNGVDKRDPLETFEPKEYTEEEKSKWDRLYKELPMALDIILFNQSFELGTYKTKFHFRNWVKVTQKELKK